MSVWRSLIRFQVRDGAQAEFERAFGDAGMLTRPRAVAGFIGAELLRSHQHGNEYIVTAQWSSPQAYAEWQRQAQSGAPRDALLRLGATLIDPQPGQLFESVEMTTDQ